jgi:hypothetical protein
MTMRASVLIPIHNKPTTLPLTVDTVLRQTVSDLEVLLIGDGVTDEVRAVVSDLVAHDRRVRFLDFPKGPHHGEKYRHEAILAAGSDAIFYLCDDDLLLPDHVADLLSLLENHSFVQSFNGYVQPDDRIGFFAADLSRPQSIEMMLREDLRFNSVSITGTAHSRAFYLEVDDPWDTTPSDQWPDHHQWRKLMRHPDFRGATSPRMTALQFPTSMAERESWSDEERAGELSRWHAVVTGPQAQQAVDTRVASAARTAIAALREQQARHELRLRQGEETLRLREARISHLENRVAALTRRLTNVRAQLAAGRARSMKREARLRRRLRETTSRIHALESSTSWRLTRPLRAIRKLVRGRPSSKR